jgi:hypothetical protein
LALETVAALFNTPKAELRKVMLFLLSFAALSYFPPSPSNPFFV